MEQSSFFNAEKTANGTYDRTYNAEDWAAYFATFVGNGVSCTPDTNLQVESSSGMNVIVNSGVAFINGYRYENTTPLTVQINQANSTYNRITSIILELNLNNRNIICTTLDGTAEPNPQPPTLIRTDSIYQLQLATVYVSAGATNCGAITDTRENTQVCGFLELLAPTLPPTLIKNCDFQNVSLHDALNNYGTINGGTISNATLNNVNITGDVNCYTTINGGALLYALLKECTLNNPTLNGGKWTNSTLNEPTVTGSLTLVGGTAIQGGAICNTIFSEEITNEATITGGTYNNPTLTGPVNLNGNICNAGSGNIYDCGIFQTIGDSKLVYFSDGKNFRLTNDNTWEDVITLHPDMKNGYNNANWTFTGENTFNNNVNINAGLYNNNNPVASASTLNVSNVHVQDNVNATINLEYWALNAGLLSANTNNLTCGIIKASITLDSNCTWNNRNPIYLNVEGFPNANAMTVTYQKNFVVGCGQNVIVLNGNNAYLNANQTYTEYALIYG